MALRINGFQVPESEDVSAKLEEFVLKDFDTSKISHVLRPNGTTVDLNSAITSLVDMSKYHPLEKVSNLKTTYKTNIVGAINEIVDNIGNIEMILDQINGEEV
jgi:hypothetical protein